MSVTRPFGISQDCPLCGRPLLGTVALVPVHFESGRSWGMCGTSAGSWTDAEAMARILREDPRLPERAHP